MDDIAVGDHVRETGTEHPVFRVVGTDDPVALLRVTSEEGGRVSSGDLRRISRETLSSEYEIAPGPGFSLARALRNQATGLYWQFRKFF